MPADPISAGRKGGQARTPAKAAAARRNGFQRAAPASQQPPDLQPGCGCTTPSPIFKPTGSAVLISQQPKEAK